MLKLYIKAKVWVGLFWGGGVVLLLETTLKNLEMRRGKEMSTPPSVKTHPQDC